MASKTTLDTLYLINDSTRRVNLDITVGDEGQKSLLTVRLDKNNLVENHDGNLVKCQIGRNRELKSKVLKITATITDVSKTTNLTFFNVKLSGGILTRSYPLYKMVDEEGDSADYYCHIEFYKP